MAVAASIALARPHESIDEGWSVATLAVAIIGVLVTADQASTATVAAVLAVAAAGAVLGRWRPVTVLASDPLLAALVVVAVIFATLPDTEGATLLGAALVAPVASALLRRSGWRGAAAGAAGGALIAATAVVAVDGAAGSTGSLVVALSAGLACAVMVVLVVRVLRGRPAAISERGRPSP